jgi:predicted dithiol-disulfide oxidoreductase (DUF899 family)
MLDHPTVSRETWLEARRALLAEEKALTRARDALAEKRRSLPWVKVDKAYSFEGPDGPVSLSDLFRGKRQLIVYHFMFAPDWEAGCTGCSFLSDHVDAIVPHLEQKDVAYVAISRAPVGKIEAFKRRMGWSFRWVSSAASDFNYDFNASFTPEQVAGAPATYNFVPAQPSIEDLPGVSVFIKGDDGQVFHTYSQYGRGGEDLLATYRLLDMLPLGRQEGPQGNLGGWVKLHDLYEAQPAACPACAVAAE